MLYDPAVRLPARRRRTDGRKGEKGARISPHAPSPTLPDATVSMEGTRRRLGGTTGKLAANSGGPGGREKARVSSRETPTVGFSKRTAFNGHERVFRSSVPAHAYIQ